VKVGVGLVIGDRNGSYVRVRVIAISCHLVCVGVANASIGIVAIAVTIADTIIVTIAIAISITVTIAHFITIAVGDTIATKRSAAKKYLYIYVHEYK
jgi:hypothetical protein